MKAKDRIASLKVFANRLRMSIPETLHKRYKDCKNDYEKKLYYSHKIPTYGEIYTKEFELRYIGKLGEKFVGTTKLKKGFATKEEAILDALRFKIRIMRDLIKS